MTDELHALTSAGLMGRIHWDRSRDRLSFVYDDQWRLNPSRYPLSLSMPLAAANHNHKTVEAFLWGLLPDNEGVLRRWGERFHVWPRNAFALLTHVGEECAGAVQLIVPERAATWSQKAGGGSVHWMKEPEIAERIRLLLQDHSVSRTGTDAGQFSLAGAQPKTGFLYDPQRNRWGVPSGVIPTTHIFKPATGTFDGYAENEHFCINLAVTLGIPTASSFVRYFDGAAVIVVERYDRVRRGSDVIRVHQEDMCQALGRRPQIKYQNQGGPSPSEIVSLIREHASDRGNDEGRFIDSLVFNWLISGTDAHAKNYSFLIAGRDQIRLAPLYDLSSALPYPGQIAPRKATLAMKIGGKYKVLGISAREWKKFAVEIQVDFEKLRARILDLAAILPDAARDVGVAITAEGISHSVIKRLTDALADRARFCTRAMG